MTGRMSAETQSKCDVCQTQYLAEDVTHLRIYVAGSEGVNVCLTCRQTLTEVLRGMMRAERAGMKRGYMACKSISKAKEPSDSERSGTTHA